MPTPKAFGVNNNEIIDISIYLIKISIKYNSRFTHPNIIIIRLSKILTQIIIKVNNKKIVSNSA